MEISYQKVTQYMIKKSKTDPIACTNNILALQDALEVIGGKWKLLILHYLLVRTDEINTFKKIDKDIEGISAKMLSKELKILEGNLLVSREVRDTKPITVRYEITDYGKEIKSLISSLVDWGQNHRLKIINQ